MKNPTEFLQGFGIGAGLITVVAAISLLSRPVPAIPGQAARQAPAEKTAVEPRVAGQSPALPPPDYLDLCREAGL